MSEPPMQATPKVARLFAKTTLGTACLVILVILGLIIIYSVFHIVPLLTETKGFVNEYVKNAPPDLQVSLAMTLDYESYAIRSHGIQVAMGFIIGLCMATFSLLLFAIGASDDFGFTGESKETKLILKTTAPGLVVMLISGVIICFAVTKNVDRSFDASFKQGSNPVIKGKEVRPPQAKIIDGPGAKDD